MPNDTNQSITELEQWWNEEPILGASQTRSKKQTKTKVATRGKDYAKVKHTTYIPTGWGFGLIVNPTRELEKAQEQKEAEQKERDRIQKQKESKQRARERVEKRRIK